MEKPCERPKVQLDESRKKCLMRKLHKIKLNKSRNHSFMDVYYESKFKKLKNNNNTLAKSLAEQRQISNSWFEEFVAAKAVIHETEQKLLRYQIIEDGNFERAIEVEMEKRLKTFIDPIETSINLSLDICLNLCENMSKVKQLFNTLVRNTKNGSNLLLSSYSRNTRGLAGSRPPLGKNGTFKSPRKNVVHPMVEGHVIGPAQICLPRVSLEDRYRYRLQERAERLDEQGDNMPAISEQSISLNEETTLTEAIVDSLEEIEQEASEGNRLILLSDNDNNQTEINSSPNMQDQANNIKEPLKNAEVIITEDPLEGPSWLHLKKRRGRKSKRKQLSSSSLQPSGTVRLVLESSSDDDIDLDVDTKKKTKLPARSTQLCLSPSRRNQSKVINKSPPLCNSNDLETKVGRRSKKKSRAASSGNDVDELLKPCPLDSFIVNETLVFEEGNSRTPVAKQCSDCPVSFKFPISESPSSFSTAHGSVNNTNNPYLVHEKENLRLCNTTCFLNSSMEMTECLTKDFINVVGSCSEINECNDKDDNLPQHNLPNCNKPKKFFKSFGEQNCENPKRILSEKTPFDASLIEPSFHLKPSYSPDPISNYCAPTVDNESNELSDATLNGKADLLLEQSELDDGSFTAVKKGKGKENVPPIKEEAPYSDESAMKLRDVTIVVQDILKSPIGDDNEIYIIKNDREKCKRELSNFSVKSIATSTVSRKRGKKPSAIFDKRKKIENFLAPLSQEMKSGPRRNSKRKTANKIFIAKPLIDKNIFVPKLCPELPNSIDELKPKRMSRRKLHKSFSADDCSENSMKTLNLSTTAVCSPLANIPLILEGNKKIGINDDLYLKGSLCQNEKKLSMSLPPVNLETLVGNPYEENLHSSFSSAAPLGFEGFAIHDRKSLVPTELSRLIAQGFDAPRDVSEIVEVQEKVLNGEDDKFIYVEPLIIDLEKEFSDETGVEIDPLSVVQLQYSHSQKNIDDSKTIIIKNSLDCVGIEHDFDAFDLHTANLIGEHIPRRRRAASQITSFKEPSLHTKLRNEKQMKKCNKKKSRKKKSNL